jgi:hypothetical protein
MSSLLPVRIVTEYRTLYYVRPIHNRRVGASMELLSRDGHKRKGDVCTSGPGEGLCLRHLQGKVHPGLVPAKPDLARLLVAEITLMALASDALKICVRETVTEIWRLDRGGVEEERLVERLHYAFIARAARLNRHKDKQPGETTNGAAKE